jgi:4-amino-4-deoxy-L-arabinose transferase-like glycosyltransferase
MPSCAEWRGRAPSRVPRHVGFRLDPALLGVVGLAVAVRLAWVLAHPNAQYSDSVWYDGAAARLVEHGQYGLDGPSAWFPPGYPFFLAAIYAVTGHVQLAGKIGNALLGGGIAAFTYLLARSFTTRSTALVSGLLVAVWPDLVFQASILSSDLLAACGFVAVLWLGTRPAATPRAFWLRAVGLGLLVGWMVLVRPVSVILLGSLGLWWWLRSRSVGRALADLVPVVAISGVIVGAWTLRNATTFGQPIPISTNGGYNFWQSNQRYADGNDTYWWMVPMDDPEYQTMRYGDEFTKNREGYRYALAFLRDHPTHILTLAPTKIFWLYHTDTSGFYEGALNPPMLAPSPLHDWIVAHARLVEAVTFRYYEVALALAVAAAAWLAWRRQTWLLPILALPLLLTVFHLLFHAKDRFHIPLDPFVALLAAVALVEAGGRLARRVPAGLPGKPVDYTERPPVGGAA